MSPRVSKILILDAGAQFGAVIDRRCRECNVESTVLPLSATSVYDIKKDSEFDAIIISGGRVSMLMMHPPMIQRYSSLGCQCWGSAMGCR